MPPFLKFRDKQDALGLKCETLLILLYSRSSVKFDLVLWANSGDQIQDRTLHRT